MAFVQALRSYASTGFLPVIPDIKCRSPKEGDLLRGRTPLAVAAGLAAAGAPVLSVVTEPEHFGGSLRLLEQVVESTGLPVLRKDFIKTEEQVRETAAAGAKAVLLIVSMLAEDQLGRLLAAAHSCGLTVLVETHNSGEIAVANRFSPALAGINNRDILKLEVDSGAVDNTEALIRRFEGNPFLLSESAIFTAEDARRARDAGADGILVGTALLQAADMAAKYRELSVALK